MSAQNKTEKSRKKRTSKKIIAHDPLSMPDEQHEEEKEAAMEAVKADDKEETADAPAVEPKSGMAIELGDALVISEVETVRAMLLEALQGGEDLFLDGSEIEQIDGAGLQLLAACILEAERMHVAFKWHSASPTLCSAAEQLGLTKVLQLDGMDKAA